MIIPCCHQAFGHCYVTVCPPRHQLPQVLCRGKSGYKFSCSGCLHHKEVDDGFTIPMPYTMPVELNCFIIQWMPYKVEIILRCKIGRAPVYWYHHRVTEVFFFWSFCYLQSPCLFLFTGCQLEGKDKSSAGGTPEEHVELRPREGSVTEEWITRARSPVVPAQSNQPIYRRGSFALKTSIQNLYCIYLVCAAMHFLLVVVVESKINSVEFQWMKHLT